MKLREMLGAQKEVAGKLAELESRVEAHDEHITALFATGLVTFRPPRRERYPGRRSGSEPLPNISSPPLSDAVLPAKLIVDYAVGRRDFVC